MKCFVLLFTGILAVAAHTGICSSDAYQVTVSGQVYCSQSKKPLASHITILADKPEPIQLSSLADGHFVALLPSVESFTVRVEAPGYEADEWNYRLLAKKDTSFFIEVYLNPVFEMTFSGSVIDAKTHQAVDAELDLFLNSDIIKEDIQLTHDGRYLEHLTKEGWYMIEINARGYLPLKDTLWFVNERRRTIHKDYELTPIEVGLNMVIDNVNFYFGKTTLRPESAGAFDRVLQLLNANPSISIEIAGHTDDEGDAGYNLTLSQGRAQAVVDHLVKQGISATRLLARGYGESAPIDTSKTKAGNAKNRRVEFTVINISNAGD